MLDVAFRPWSRRKHSNAGHLRCISGLVRTSKFDDDTGIDRVLPIAAQTTSDQLELSVHLLWLAQETSEITGVSATFPTSHCLEFHGDLPRNP